MSSWLEMRFWTPLSKAGRRVLDGVGRCVDEWSGTEKIGRFFLPYGFWHRKANYQLACALSVLLDLRPLYEGPLNSEREQKRKIAETMAICALQDGAEVDRKISYPMMPQMDCYPLSDAICVGSSLLVGELVKRQANFKLANALVMWARQLKFHGQELIKRPDEISLKDSWKELLEIGRLILDDPRSRENHVQSYINFPWERQVLMELVMLRPMLAQEPLELMLAYNADLSHAEDLFSGMWRQGDLEDMRHLCRTLGQSHHDKQALGLALDEAALAEKEERKKRKM